MKRLGRIATLRLPKHTPLILGVALVFLVLLVFWVDTARLPYIASNFSYTADLNTTDNFYDQERQRYAGGRNSYTRYSATPISQDDDGIVSIEAAIETTALDGSRVGGAKRVYGIDRIDGRHVRDEGSRVNKGYMFAPRGLEKGESFMYQHATYEPVATMEYKAEEDLLGLTVYRYETRYADTNRIDYTEYNRDAVPIGQGLEYEPELTIWVEPVTGWMINYEEATTVYAYDRATGQRVAPVNHFSSVFTEASVKQHAAYAQDLKYRLAFGQEIVPAVIFISVLVVLLWLLVRRLKVDSLPIGLATAFVLLISLASLAGWVFTIEPLLALPAGGTGINPVVSLCFVFAAVCTQLIYRKKLQVLGIVLSAVIILIALLGIARGATLVGFDIDLLFLGQNVLDAPAGISGRMSLFEAFLLLLLGAALLKNFLPDKVAPFYFARLASGLVVVLAVFGFIAKLLLLDDIFAVTIFGSLSAGSTVLFMVSGAALLQLRLHYHDRDSDLRAVGRGLGQSALLAIPLVVIGIFAQVQQYGVKYQLQSAFNAQVETLQTAIVGKIENYASVLTGEKALFAASQEVERPEWKEYTQALNLPNKYPGIIETGYAKVITKNELADFTARAQDSYPGFKVTTINEQDVYVPILYATTPGETIESPVVGFDLYSEPTRGEVMERARDSGQPNLSGKVSMLKNNEPGFMLFLPVYTQGVPLNTVPERRQALTGYVYVTFTTASLIKDIATSTTNKDVVIQIYDGLKAEQDRVIFGQDPTPDFTARLERTETVYVGNHPWTIRYKARPTLQLSSLEERLPTYILFGGTLVYLVLLVLIFWGRNLRKRIKEERRNASRQKPIKK